MIIAPICVVTAKVLPFDTITTIILAVFTVLNVAINLVIMYCYSFTESKKILVLILYLTFRIGYIVSLVIPGIKERKQGFVEEIICGIQLFFVVNSLIGLINKKKNKDSIQDKLFRPYRITSKAQQQ